MSQGKRSARMVKGAMSEAFVSSPRPHFDYQGLLQEWLQIIESGTNEQREHVRVMFLNNCPFTPKDQELIMEAVRKNILK